MLKKKKATRPVELKCPRRGYTQIPTDKYTQTILQSRKKGGVAVFDRSSHAVLSEEKGMLLTVFMNGTMADLYKG